MQWRNSKRHYGAVSMVFHWLIAVCVIGLIVVGKYMTQEGLDFGLQFKLYQLHKSFGVLVFVLMILRLMWRMTQVTPPYPDHMAGWERAGAHLSHFGLYVLMLVMPLTGWAMVSASTFKIPTLLFGNIPLPHLGFLENTADPKYNEWLTEEIHYVLGFVIIFVLLLHVGAALKHHLIDKDDVLTRMLPGKRG
jgi:cytochrome b561